MDHMAIIPMDEYNEFIQWKRNKYKKKSSVVYEDDWVPF